MSVTKTLIGMTIIVALATPVLGQTPPAAPAETVGATMTLPEMPPLPVQPAGPVLTVDEAIVTAVVNNPGLAVARERVVRTRNQVREAMAQSRFTVGLQAGYSRTGPSSTITLPGSSESIQTRAPSSTTAAATINQPIDLNGRLSLVRQLAGLQLDITEYAEAQTLQQLIANVKTAYYNVLRAIGNVDVAQSSLAVAEERLRLARAQFEAGVSPKFDVTSAEVDVANRQQTLIQAQSAVDAAKGALNQTMGVDINRPMTVQDQPVAVAPVTVDIPAITTTALDSRPEVRQARFGIGFAERNVRFTSKENSPTLAAFATTNWTSETSAFSANKTTYTYGVSANWPIWNGGATKARVAEARNDVDIAKRNLDQATLAVELDVRTSALNVMESSRRVQTARANVDAAREALRLARVRYQEGVSTQVEVTTAEAALTQALTNEVNARYDYLNAEAQLQRAMAAQPEYSALVAVPSAPSANSGAEAAPAVTSIPPVPANIVAPKNPVPAEIVTPVAQTLLSVPQSAQADGGQTGVSVPLKAQGASK